MAANAYTRYASLAGRTIVITGGSSGIGAELVAAFAHQGAQVHFLDIDPAGGNRVATETGARFHACDLTQIEMLRTTLAAIETEAGVIDVLVNNAGNDDRHDLFAVEPAYWHQRLAINLDHQFFATQAVARGMMARGAGAIILLSSTSFVKGRPGMVAYTTAKAAIIGLNRTLAREFGPSGVRVNCILPGAVSTERQEALWRTPEAVADIQQSQALKITLVASDIAAMALFLASDDARGCTGAQFVVDAGIT